MSEPQDAGKYQTNIDGTVQGQVTGDNNKVEIHIHNPQDKALSPTNPQRIWNIPYLRNDYFTGREDILAQLHTRFKANNATALSQRHAMSGLGGIGKTQTAVEYAYRYHQDYQAVLWARAESHEALTSSFVEIARLLDLPQKDEQDQTIIVQAVKRWLQDNNGWLLILDNADEPKIVREFLPTKFDGHVLLTTRAQALGGLAQRIEVDTMEQDVGALLLLCRAGLIGYNASLEATAPADIIIAREITKELGGLPLALDQAGAYIEETSCSLSDYLSLYRTQRAEVLKERGGLVGDHPDSVTTTWSLSFQRVEEKNAAAADLLRLCAFLAPDAIAEEIITTGVEHLGPALQTIANDPIELNKAIAALGAYSLIRRDPAQKNLSIHRLVQAVLRDALSTEETKMWIERTVRAVDAAFPNVKFAQWSVCEQCLPHAQSCCGLMTQDQMILPEVADLLTKIGWYLWEHGQYQEAEAPLRQALTLREYNLGSEHQDTAQSLSVLALLYREQGKYTEAEPLHQRGLAIYEQLWPEHPYTATSLHNLAELYREQGKYELAEPLYERALAIDEKALGSEHPDLATDLNGLALLYNNQGKYELAEPLYERALAIYEKQLGPEHPYTASSLNNLALLYHNQGKFAQAEPLYVRALHIREQQLGPEHPDTALSLYCLAYLYQHQKKYEQSRLLYARALSIYQQKLGEMHPNTRALRQNYATLLRAMGRDEEAKQLEEGNES